MNLESAAERRNPSPSSTRMVVSATIDFEESDGAYSNPNDIGETPLTVNMEVNNAVGAISLKPFYGYTVDNPADKQSISNNNAGSRIENGNPKTASNEQHHPWYNSLTRLYKS